MGLDMYARALHSKPATPVDFDMPDDSEELHYWRKHPNLHGWMKALYKSKGGASPDFNCNTLQLTADDLDKLEADIKGDHLPETTGFFFGKSSPEDKASDLEFIAKARAALAAGKSVSYDSWW